MGQTDVLSHGEVRHEPLALTVLRYQGVAGAQRGSRITRRERPSSYGDVAGGDGGCAEEGARERGAACPHQAGHAQDLTAVQRERDVAQETFGAQTADLQHGFALTAATVAVFTLLHLAADHQANQRGAR